MGLYLNNLPNKKLELIYKIGEYIGNQNVYEPEIDLSIITKEIWNNNIKTKSLICIIDNGSFDAALVITNFDDIKYYGDIDGENSDYRPRYWFWLNNKYIKIYLTKDNKD